VLVQGCTLPYLLLAICQDDSVTLTGVEFKSQTDFIICGENQTQCFSVKKTYHSLYENDTCIHTVLRFSTSKELPKEECTATGKSGTF